MNRRIMIAVSLIAVIALTATAVGIAFAFLAETYNSDNDYTAEPTTIAARESNDASSSLLKVGLPAPTEGDGYTGNGPWVLSYQSGVVTGYLEIRCPDGANGTGNMRVWLEAKYPEVWSIVQRVTLRLEDDSREYVLFGADSELLEVAGEPNRLLIPVSTHTGNDLLGFRLIVTYKSELTVNPQAIMGDDYAGENRLQIVQKILSSRLVFTMAEMDPVTSLKINYVRGTDVLQTVEAYRGNVLMAPVFSGYNIGGWYIKSDFSEDSKWDFPSYHVDERYWTDMGAQDNGDGFNLYAKDSAAPTVYTIDYDLNGGSAVNPESYTVLTESFALTNPTKDGYTFTGWTGTGLTEKTTNVIIPKGSSGNRAYVANWTGNTYTIAFDRNGGVGETMSDITDAAIGTAKILPRNTYTKEGYVFAGWDGNNDNGVDYFDESSVYDPISLTNNKMTLKAVWTNHDVTFSDGGTPTPETFTVKGFKGYILPECRFNSPPLLGTTFVGWGWGGNIYQPDQTVDLSSVDTVTAQWGFRLIYLPNGGMGTSPASVPAMPDTVLTIADQGRLSKEGFTFSGWNTSADGEGVTYLPGSTVTMTSGDIRLYAVWKCTVSYNANGADPEHSTVPESVIVKPGQSVTIAEKPGNLSRTGCTFSGWNTMPNGRGVSYEIGSTVPADTDIKLYAIWTCTVAFNGNGATGGSEPLGGTYVCGEMIPIPGNTGELVKTGLDFGGWNTNSSYTGDTYREGDHYIVNGNVTFYAMWGHTVHFDLEGLYDDIYQFVLEGEKATAPDMNYDDYDFRGWFTDQALTIEYDFNTTVTSSFPLYAKWIVTVYFICNDDSNAPDQRQEFIQNRSAAIDNERVPLNANPNVTGWNTRADYSGTYYPKTSLTPRTNMGLYAVWDYHVTYYKNGGRGNVPVDSTDYPLNQSGTATVMEKPGDLIRNGCTFFKWNTAKDGSGTYYVAGDTISVTDNITLYAIWETGVTYDPNGADSGTAPTDANTYKADISTVTVLGNTGSLVKDGCTFGGWNTRSDGTGDIYQAGDTFTLKGATTLYAIWVCTLTYDANGADSGTAPTATVTESGTSLLVKAHGDLSKESGNYVFIGWNTRADGMGTMYLEDDVLYITGDTTLYAIWGHTIAFNNNGGSGVMSMQYVKHGVSTSLNAMKFVAPYLKEFDHWNTEPDDTGMSYADGDTISITSNTILYAIWRVQA